MRRSLSPRVSWAARWSAALGLVALIAGWLGLLVAGGAPAAAGGATLSTAGRKLFLPLVVGGTAAQPPLVAASGLSFAVDLSPDRVIAPGGLLRARVTAFNGTAERLSLRDLTLRYDFAQLAYERIEGDQVLVTGQSGDFTTVLFRSIGAGEKVEGTVLFRVRDSLIDGATISLTSEYFCGDELCKGNLAQVQVGALAGALESTDQPQELLVAPTRGGLDSVFRFSTRKFAGRDRVQLWVGNDSGSVRQLPKEYAVDPDGWVRFELKGSEFGPGSWNLLAYGSISGFTSITSFTVAAGPAQLEAPQLTAGRASDVTPIFPVAAADASTTPTQARGEGGIAGRVTDATTGAGVADVLVVALSDGRPVASAVTRANGGYLIPIGLATGSYTLRALASSAGGALTYQDATVPQPVAVTSPELTAGVNLSLARGGAIAGRVTASDTRRGLGGVGVEVIGPGETIVGSGATRADGSYVIEGLPEGSLGVRFVTETGDDGEVVAYATATIADVAVSAGATVFVDQSLSLRPTVAIIRGRVSGSGSGLPGVFVAVFDGEADLVSLTLTEADGRYATGPLPNGSYRLAFITFFAESATTRRHISSYFNGSASLAGATPVVIAGPGTVNSINGALVPGGALSGAVRGADGAGLPGVLVAAYDADGGVQSVARSDSSGAYELPALAAGSYRLGFFSRYAADAAVRRYQDSYYNGKATLATADAVAVGAGQTVTNINGVLSQGGTIAGRVTADDNGAGLKGVVVIAVDGSGAIKAVALSDASGTYETPGLAPGAYTVLFDTILAPVEATRAYLDEYFDNREDAPFTPVNVTTGATATANAGLARGGQIAGRVTAADSGLGLRGVAVLVYSGATLVDFAMTDASGAYTTSGLPAGSYTVQFDPTLSADQETEQYAASTLPNPIGVTVGSVTQGADGALTRP